METAFVKSVIILGKLVHTYIGVGFSVCNLGDLFHLASLFFSSIYFSKGRGDKEIFFGLEQDSLARHTS
jgi:hypothetical protein